MTRLLVAFFALFDIMTFHLWIRDEPLLSIYCMPYPFFILICGLLLTVSEFQAEPVTLYFAFLRTFLGRGLFLIL